MKFRDAPAGSAREFLFTMPYDDRAVISFYHSGGYQANDALIKIRFDGKKKMLVSLGLSH